jgi:GR25 family glycosyltransferase involved in LPS biosynthesis
LAGVRNLVQIIILGDINGTRIEPLLSLFGTDTRFQITIQEPIYLENFKDKRLLQSGFDIEKSSVYMMRELALTEIGCALAHNAARQYLASTNCGGVVLEDDARILDIDYFYAATTLFLNSMKDPSVLNLASVNRIEMFESDIPIIPTLVKRRFYSPLNVGYALNKLGAQTLAETPYRLYNVSDWPYSNINKYILASSVVAHGDQNTSSTIDPQKLLNRSKIGWKNRLALITFYYYYKNRNSFDSLLEYVQVMLKPRFAYHFYSFLKNI